MERTEIFIILALFLTMKTTFGQRKESINCRCYTAATPHVRCSGPGCSRGSNPNCTGTSPSNGGDIIFYRSNTDGYLGCNCPDYQPVAFLNGFYGTVDNIRGDDIRRHDGIGITGHGYIYATCTDFGGNARNSGNRRPDNANDATDCCNYCCNRNDARPYGLSGGVIAAIIIASIAVVVVIGGIVRCRRRRRTQRTYMGY